MDDTERAMRGEEIRVRQKYRALVMRGRLNLPLSAVVRLVGPDCAFHAYRRLAASSPKRPLCVRKGIARQVDATERP